MAAILCENRFFKVEMYLGQSLFFEDVLDLIITEIKFHAVFETVAFFGLISNERRPVSFCFMPVFVTSVYIFLTTIHAAFSWLNLFEKIDQCWACLILRSTFLLKT